MPDILENATIQAFLADFPAWSECGGALHRGLKFRDFATALRFMNEVGAVAEEMNHHPDWSNSYNRVEVALRTHSSGGITELDLALARRMDEIASRLG